MSGTDPPRDDFDGPWKEALERFLEPALALLAPELHRDIDWHRQVEFLNKELLRFLPEGGAGGGTVDVLAQVWLKSGSPARLLLHAEVQGDPEADFAHRLFRYWYRLFDARQVPVVSLVILVKLIDLEPRLDRLEQSTNPFALFVVAYLAAQRNRDGERRLYWKLRLVRRLLHQNFSREDGRLLLRLVDWVLRLPKELKTCFLDEVRRMEEQNKVEFVDCFEELAMERATRRSILQVLGARFGSVPPGIEQALADLHDLATLEDLTRTAATVPDQDAFARALSAL